jgi:cation diffusion facilitator CzcD-associated flavoprotein CzcO
MPTPVLVIGAGPAGICAAYHLERRAVPYRVVERADVAAPTWANLYPSLQLNTLSLNSHLPGELIPLRYGFYPMGWQYHEYVRRYVEKRAFNITFGVHVTRVTPHNGGWRVESSEGIDDYPVVVLATGRFSKPYLPVIPGIESFTGRLLHAHDVRDPSAFRGQRVLVIGAGPSGGDLAAAIADCAATPVLLSIRSDLVLARKYPFGVPHSIWQLMIGVLPTPMRKPLLNALVYRGYPGMHRLPITFAPNREDRIGTSAPIRGRELYDALKHGRVNGVKGVARFSERCVELTDGSQHEIDTAILSTGYRVALDYLDIPFEKDHDGFPVRALDPIYGDQGMQVAGYPGLFWVGRYYRGKGALRNFRYEARIAAAQIARYLD